MGLGGEEGRRGDKERGRWENFITPSPPSLSLKGRACPAAAGGQGEVLRTFKPLLTNYVL